MSLGNKKIMAHNIQRLMDEKGVSRQDVCDALGIKYTTFVDWIYARNYPRIDKIEMMANYFGVSKATLVEPEGTQDFNLLMKNVQDNPLLLELVATANHASDEHIKMIIKLLKEMK